MRGLAFRHQLAGLNFPQLISEVKNLLAHMFQIGPHNDLVIIVHRRLIAAAGIGDRYAAVVVPFHIFITEAELPQQFHPPHFKPDEMISVIDDPHLIGFGIADSYASLIHRHIHIRECDLL